MRKPQQVTALVLEVFRLNGALLEAGNRLTGPLGLTSARWQVLGAIAEEGRPLTVAQVARRMGLTRQNVQRIANELARLHFVTFEDNPDHKRAKLVRLTPGCEAALDRLADQQAAWANELAKGVGRAALGHALQTLSDIRTRCEDMEEAARTATKGT